jgi:hypothetical protein
MSASSSITRHRITSRYPKAVATSKGSAVLTRTPCRAQRFSLLRAPVLAAWIRVASDIAAAIALAEVLEAPRSLLFFFAI